MQKPINCTAPELAKVSVELIDFIQVQLKCRRCQEIWKPVREHGRLTAYYWRCPNGCNVNRTASMVQF